MVFAVVALKSAFLFVVYGSVSGLTHRAWVQTLQDVSPGPLGIPVDTCLICEQRHCVISFLVLVPSCLVFVSLPWLGPPSTGASLSHRKLKFS